jgi:DNA-binding NarL/FixJ family response regulator
VIRSASQSHAGLQPVQISPGTSILVGRLPDSQFVILLARQSVDNDASLQLTDAETRLLVALVRGERLAAYAQRNAIKLTTAKTHLQALFGKSGQRRQADLIRWALSTGRFGTTGTD